MKSLPRFILFAVGILVPPYVYLGFSLGDGSPLAWVALALPFLSILTMPILVFAIDRSREIWWRDLLSYAANFSMGVTTYLAVFTLLRDVLRWTDLAVLPAWSVLALTALALLVGGLSAWTGPRIKRVRVPIKDLDPSLRGFRIVQISDLHVSATIRKTYVARVVRMTNELKPDLVALTGDIADGDLTRMRPHAAPLADLEPKGRVYYVPGNHEYYWNLSDWLYEFQRLGCTLLLNAGARVNDALWIGGVTDPAAAGFAAATPNVAAALTGGEAFAFKMLLSHRPEYARPAAELGFDLQLSGHTHGGQFFPWTIVVAFVHEFNLGLKRAGRAWIYVSPGTGTWGPLLRLGTTPELTLLTLEAE